MEASLLRALTASRFAFGDRESGGLAEADLDPANARSSNLLMAFMA
jgi:hypothetical protein